MIKITIKLKIRDHCHYTGKCRGVAHSACNSRYMIPKENPLVIHNESNYDYYFIKENLSE